MIVLSDGKGGSMRDKLFNHCCTPSRKFDQLLKIVFLTMSHQCTNSILVFPFPTPNDCAKFNQIRFKIAYAGAMTDRHTDVIDLIICRMLCYSNGTDNNL